MIRKLLKTKQGQIAFASAAVLVLFVAVILLVNGVGESPELEREGLASGSLNGSTALHSAEDEPAAPDETAAPGRTAEAPSASSTGSGTAIPSTDSEIKLATGSKAADSIAPKPSSTPKDKYQTDPVPEGKPLPQEPEETTVDKKQEYAATLSIRCDTIWDNMEKFNQDKLAVLPSDGVVMDTRRVLFFEGESVFDVLERETRASKIHLEFVFTPLYNSVYIEGIHNLYEFDCGELSGWMYKVNDWFPNYGATRYLLKEGDVIEWVYTCDLGRDVGGVYSVGEN